MTTNVAFSFTDGARSRSRLSELIGGHPALNVDALAARAVALPPTEPDETPYVGVRCALVEPSVERPAPSVPVARSARGASGDSARAPHVLRHALEAAVARTLGDARCVAVMAGGGLDSAGLLALAVAWARPRGARVFAVALDYAARCDDRPYLRMLEASLGCDVVRVSPEDGARHLAWMGGVDAAPFGWPSGPMEMEMMARAREHGAECVLMGIGGDEIFDGQPEALASVARRGAVRAAVRSARRLRGFDDQPRSRTLSWIVRPLVGRVTPTTLRLRLARRSRTWLPAWAGGTLTRYAARIDAREMTALERNLPRGVIVDPMHPERHRANIAWLRHQEEIVAGVERRDPFLDRELIETVATFEPSLLLHGDIRRGLFREALRDMLPAPLLEREDKAYFEPAFMRMVDAAGGLDAFRDLASGRELAALDIVHPARFRAAFEAFVAAPDEGLPWMTVWPALCVEAFLRASRTTGHA